MYNPMVSIIIPVYNGSNYMREAIDSALAQTYKNFEIIVVNDGSNDGGKTEEIALSYGDKIRYFAKENGGVATALNLGIQEMRGEYFSWLSHDDLYYPEKLTVQIEALRACGDWTSIVYSDYDWKDMTSGNKHSSHISDCYPLARLENSVFPVLCGLIHGCVLLIHKSHFVRVGKFDETLITSQDYDLWFRMFRDQKLLFVPQPLICGRIHPEQGTNTISSFQDERGNFHLKSFLSISDDEIYKIFGHPAVLCGRIWSIFDECGMKDACEEVIKRSITLKIPEILEEKENQFRAQFAELCGDTDTICIFCCGVYGKHLLMLLSDLGIKVDFFSDNNPKLWGRLINGIPCISPSELQKINSHTLILAAVRAPEPVLKQLEQLGCSHVVTKQTVEKMLCCLD